MCFSCPSYQHERTDLYKEVESDMQSEFQSCGDQWKKLDNLLSSSSQQTWIAFSRVLSRVRQKRRRFRTQCYLDQKHLQKHAFITCKSKWRNLGRKVCRHGMFFRPGHTKDCTCLSNSRSTEPDWNGVVFMPASDPRLKAIVTVPFDVKNVHRLGQLQSHLRSYEW